MTKSRHIHGRRVVFAATLCAAVAGAAIAFVPAAIEGTSSNKNGLFAYVVASNRGPLSACPGGASDCSASTVWWYVHVSNANKAPNQNVLGTNRATLPNSFVISSIDETILTNGVEVGQGTLTPPPNLTDRFGTAGHWPSTVTCTGQPGTYQPPCNVVTSPAIVPGEDTVTFWDGWVHATPEPNGIGLAKFTIHGTLNGTPVDLTATSPAIFMTN